MSYKTLEERSSYWKMHVFNFCYKHMYSLVAAFILLIGSVIYIYSHLSNLHQQNLKNSLLIEEYKKTGDVSYLEQIVKTAYADSPYYKLANLLLDIEKGREIEDQGLFARISNILNNDVTPVQPNEIESEILYIKNGVVPFEKNDRIKLALIGQEEPIEL